MVSVGIERVAGFSSLDGAVSDGSVMDNDNGASAGCAIIGGYNSAEVGTEVEVEEGGCAIDTSVNTGVLEAAWSTITHYPITHFFLKLVKWVLHRVTRVIACCFRVNPKFCVGPLV